jgi:DNA-binding transcriptional MerR regulator
MGIAATKGGRSAASGGDLASGIGRAMSGIDETILAKLEKSHATGLTSAEILDVFATHDVTLSEATLRKYVQLGLLPRSVRVGTKGKHQGSKGLYPVRVVRQILQIKQMMAQEYTIEQIQTEFLFVRSELEQLDETLVQIFDKLESAVKRRKQEATARVVAREVGEARLLSKDLLSRLRGIETRLTSRARLDEVSGAEASG